MRSATTAAGALIRRLDGMAALGNTERAALETLPIEVADLGDHHTIVHEGDQPTRSIILVSGLACSFKILPDGSRQIVAFHHPGDTPDVQSLHLKVMDNSLATISPCRVGYVRHDVLRELCLRYPTVAAALWKATLVDGSIYREWLSNLGQRKAPARMAHLFCETFLRKKMIGDASGESCDFPLTQGELSDALGISVVHVNRTLMQLRSAGLADLSGGRLVILDWQRLRVFAQYDTTYLHLEGSISF
jgi:CRP-like cAMP-binding protein